MLVKFIGRLQTHVLHDRRNAIIPPAFGGIALGDQDNFAVFHIVKIISSVFLKTIKPLTHASVFLIKRQRSVIFDTIILCRKTSGFHWRFFGGHLSSRTFSNRSAFGLNLFTACFLCERFFGYRVFSRGFLRCLFGRLFCCCLSSKGLSGHTAGNALSFPKRGKVRAYRNFLTITGPETKALL